MTTILPEKHIRELKDHRDSQNKDRLYQATKKETYNKELQAKIKLGREISRLKNQHDNWFLDQQMEMIKQELITMINERKAE